MGERSIKIGPYFYEGIFDDVLPRHDCRDGPSEKVVCIILVIFLLDPSPMLLRISLPCGCLLRNQDSENHVISIDWAKTRADSIQEATLSWL